MADPLSLASSIIALTVFVRTTANALQTLIQDIRSFPKELDGILKELQSLGLVLGCLEKSADSNPAFTELSPTDLNSTRLLDVLAACKPTITKIQKKVYSIRTSVSQSSVNKLFVGFFWSATKKDLRELRRQLEYHKTTLLLSVQLKSL
jgi:Fungal N-terminal domain of STAND proteins